VSEKNNKLLNIKEYMLYKHYIVALLFAVNTMSFAYDTATLSRLPNQAVLHAMLEGNSPSKIIKSQSDSDYIIMIRWHRAILIGNPTETELATIAYDLLQNSDVSLICEERLQGFFVQHGFMVQPRIGLEFCAHNKPSHPLPAGFTLLPLNTIELLRQCMWYNRVVNGFYDGPENFLKKGFGFALIDDKGTIVSESYGSFIGGGLCELSIVTKPNEQSKGYATIAAERAMQECLQRNLKPRWSCNSENGASLKVALKLGFQITNHYAFLVKAPTHKS
jgi:hypothetical protein